MRKKSLEILMKERVTRRDVREYVAAVEDLTDAYEAVASVQSAFDMSMKQLEMINGMTDNLRKLNDAKS